jgi:hypothetical protein
LYQLPSCKYLDKLCLFINVPCILNSFIFASNIFMSPFDLLINKRLEKTISIVFDFKIISETKRLDKDLNFYLIHKLSKIPK